MMKIDEENLVRCLKKKNEKALDYVIDQYGGLIKSIVVKHLYSLQSQQEECINDVLLSIWNGIGSFDENRNTFKNWVAAISKYKCIDYKRKYMKLLLEQGLEENEVIETLGIEEEVLKDELSHEVESLLRCLKVEDRKLFLGHYIEDRTVEDLAQEMGVKSSAVYNRLSRGRKKLKSIWENR